MPDLRDHADEQRPLIGAGLPDRALARFPSRKARLAPALVSLVGAVYIVLVAVFSRPIADDWSFSSDAERWSFGRYMQFNLGSSGRFSQFAFSWLSVRLFGDNAHEVVALLLLGLAVGVGAWTVRGLARRLEASLTWTEAGWLALLLLVATIATAPSVYDTVAWFAAVVAYLAGAVVALVVVACIANSGDGTGRRSFPLTVALAATAALAGGFDELVGASMVLAGILGIFTTRELHSGSGTRHPAGRLAVIILGAAVGTAANVFGPGAQSRAASQGAHVSVSAAASTAIHNLSFLRADVRTGVLLLAIAAGIVGWQLLGPTQSPLTRRWIARWALFFLLVPWLITATVTAWAGSTESGDRSPFRAASIGTASVALALVLLVVLVLSRWPRMLTQRRATLLATVLAALGVVGLAHNIDPIIRAEQLRAQALSVRANSITRQLAAGSHTIEIAPAPLLTVFTQAFDLSFAPRDQQRAGFVAALTQYYDIPEDDKIKIESTQPRDYCLPNVAASWVAVRSCQQLQAHH